MLKEILNLGLASRSEALPATFGEFWNKYGHDVERMRSQIQHIRQKQISLVSSYDQGFLQSNPEQASTKSYANKFACNLWVYVAVNEIARAVSMLDLKAYRKVQTPKGIVLEISEDNLATELLQKPSLYDTSFNLKMAMIGSLKYAGNAYIYFDPQLKEIWALRPQHVTINADRLDFIDSYTFQINSMSDKLRLQPEQVIHLKEFNSNDYHYGQSPLSASFGQANLIESDLKFWQNFWKHGGRVMGAWSTESSLSDIQYERVQSQIKNKYKGMDNMFRDILLESGMKYEQLGVTQSDAQLIDKYKLSRDDILAAYGVPSSIAGVLDQANYSNMDVQERLFWQKTIMPTLALVEQAFNANTILSENGTLIFKFDVSKVSVLQENELEKAKLGAMLIESSQWTPNEVREKLWSKDPIVGDGDILKPVAATTTPFFGRSAPAQIEAPSQEKDLEVNKPKAPRSRRYSKDKILEMAKNHEDQLIQHDKKVMKTAKGRFSDQRETVLRNIRSLLKEVGSRPVERGDLNRLTSGMIDRQSEFASHLRSDLIEVANYFGHLTTEDLKAQAKKTSKRAKGLKKKDIADFNGIDPRVQRYLKERTVAVAGIVDEFTLSSFRDGIAAQLEEDASIEAVTKYTQSFFDGMETWRAARIARTETASAAAFAQDQTLRQNSDVIEQKEWVTAGDEFVRDSHQEVEPVSVEDNFILGSGVETPSPGNSGIAEEDINCRCAVVGIVKTSDNEGD
jgi:HK97 family phage portal protein